MVLSKLERRTFLQIELYHKLPWKSTGLPPQQELDFGRHKLHILIQSVRDEFFPEIKTLPTVTFARMNSLASICTCSYPPHITISALLNRPDTPIPVLLHILKHEFLHLKIHHREIDGKEVPHPPEFWEYEQRISPQHETIWNWIGYNFGDVLKRNTEVEKIDVPEKAYKKKVKSFCSLEEADQLMPFPINYLWGK